METNKMTEQVTAKSILEKWRDERSAKNLIAGERIERFYTEEEKDGTVFITVGIKSRVESSSISYVVNPTEEKLEEARWETILKMMGDAFTGSVKEFVLENYKKSNTPSKLTKLSIDLLERYGFIKDDEPEIIGHNKGEPVYAYNFYPQTKTMQSGCQKMLVMESEGKFAFISSLATKYNINFLHELKEAFYESTGKKLIRLNDEEISALKEAARIKREAREKGEMYEIPLEIQIHIDNIEKEQGFE